MEIFYDIPYMKVILLYVLVPVAFLVLVVGLVLFSYSRKHKDHEDEHYNFVMNFWSSLIGIIITGALLALAIGFSIAMTEKMKEYGIVNSRKMIYYLLKYFVIVPIAFVIWYIVKLVKTILHRPTKEKEDPEEKEDEEDQNSEQEYEEEQGEIMDSDLPPIEESLQEEIQKYEEQEENEEEKVSSDNTNPDEEIEIISFDEEEENHE